MTAIVEVDHLSRSFGRTQALSDVTLRIEQGGVFGLVGENGAGKTTLIKHILGLLKARARLGPSLRPQSGSRNLPVCWAESDTCRKIGTCPSG